MIGWRHVHRDRLDLRSGPSQPLPEWFQRVSSLAVADEDHSTALEVQNDCHVAVALSDGNLVDGDLMEVLQLGLGVAAAEVALLDVLDDIPADTEVSGHIEDGHTPGQFQG